MDEYTGRERRQDDGKIWSAIEELRRGQAVREEKLDSFIAYQRERNSEVMSGISSINSQVGMLRSDLIEHTRKEDEINSSFFKKGVMVLGATVTGLIVYIWQNMVGKSG